MSYIKNPTAEWYSIRNIDEVDSPALIIHPARVQHNIELAKQMVGDTQRLRPHVKTNKISEVSAMLLEAGITKFKCATIAEAEMLATLDAPDVLLSYQPTGPKITRFINLIKAYPSVQLSCLVDNAANARSIAALAEKNGVIIRLFIDLNIGMNRSGIKPEHALELAKTIVGLKRIKLVGLHAYDGHIRDVDFAERKKNTDAGFKPVETLVEELKAVIDQPLQLAVGGTPTFPVHAARKNVECSPGTFVFSDWGYKHALPDEAFEYAAILISRVISIIDDTHICTDLGHKSVAAENPLDKRVHFLNAPEAIPTGQSEEHLVLQVTNANEYAVGDVLYGVPVHICPTVALYDKVFVAENGTVHKSWNVVARNRYINF